jgi:hypothetical protein
MRLPILAVLFSAAALMPVALLAQSEGTAAVSAGAGKPANLCQELVNFVRQPAEAVKADSTPKSLAPAVQATKPGDTPAKASDAAGAPQTADGVSGQATSAGPGASGPQGQAQTKEAPAGSTATAAGPPQAAPSPAPAPAAPAPAAPPAATAPQASPEAIQAVEAAAEKKDLSGCRAAAQQMRRAGVVMPAPLLALSAMDVRLLEAAQQP